MKASWIPWALGAASFVGCKSEHHKSVVPPTPSVCERSRDTSSYLTEAVGSRFFRWTQASGQSETIVPIEVDDRSLPSGLSQSDAQSIVTVARDAWRAVLSSRGFATSTRFLSSQSGFDRTRAKVTVRFISGFSGAKVGHVIPITQGTRVAEMRMELAANGPDGSPLSPRERTGIAIHEFGHAFGIVNLGGGTAHSPSPLDIMYPTTQCSFASLSNGDQRTIDEIYARTPAFVRIDAP